MNRPFSQFAIAMVNLCLWLILLGIIYSSKGLPPRTTMVYVVRHCRYATNDMHLFKETSASLAEGPIDAFVVPAMAQQQLDVRCPYGLNEPGTTNQLLLDSAYITIKVVP